MYYLLCKCIICYVKQFTNNLHNKQYASTSKIFPIYCYLHLPLTTQVYNLAQLKAEVGC